MPDAFDILRATGGGPLAPDPAFAARLRRRLAARLARPVPSPKGAAMTATTAATTDPALRPPERGDAAARPALTPYLAVAGAEAAIVWYVDALGARVVEGPIVMPDGRIGHAELELAAGGARLMLADEHPEIGVTAPAPGEGARVTLHLDVRDVDAVLARALTAGAALERAASDEPYGRQAVFRDPFGHRWMLSGARADVGRRHGDIGYASLNVPDAGRAAAFYGAVLDWRYEPAAAGRSRQVVGQGLHHGIWGQDGPPTLFLAFAVADLDAALAAVAAAGGTAGGAEEQPWGRVADCHDDQGTAFALYQPPAGALDAGAPRPAGPARPGDLVYVTLEVPDPGKARAFYGSVLGWRAADDGGNVAGVHPRIGILGGAARATAVPVYAVAGLDAALARVGDAGGTAGPAEHEPYGRIAECRDDQGTRFALLEV